MCHLSKSNNILPPFNVNVLVVDDDAASLNKTIEILTSLNYKGTRHCSLALDELRNRQGYFQLFIMEVHMPDLDGFKLKQIIDEEFGIPIIMISVDNSEEIQKKALMSGVMRYILKPAKSDDFVGIWQFAVAVIKGKKPINNTKIVGDIMKESSIVSGESNHHKKISCSSSIQEDSRVEEKSDDMVQSSLNTNKKALKKTKFIWTKDLQSKFLNAIDILGPEGYSNNNYNNKLDFDVKRDVSSSNDNSIIPKPYPKFPNNAIDAYQQKSASNSSSLLMGVGSTIGEVYDMNQTSPMLMGGSSIVGNIGMEESLFQPQQDQHQIYNQMSSCLDNNFANSQGTSIGSNFKGNDYAISMEEDFLNQASMQHEEAVNSNIQSNDYIPPCDQFPDEASFLGWNWDFATIESILDDLV
ncbi:hypothetical protein VNO78_26316 [Psophocarpus tetragonolobus]|uniref:Response regulatory domain-containing protein n=1 Tax=Psophocarpus tetragonolobus TaxID=3891 RepID=A0AAN9RZT1_PSOTE